jgi:alkanesulfonate monooxygenase SsuD/methylene tetrahydromethanopterin reductase-like flavin-dependent oxidoreductase (luciferase family)
MATRTADDRLTIAGIDAVALKPAEHDLRRARALPVGTIAIDYEGRDHVPTHALLEELAADREVRLTLPIRADGFDPLGDDTQLDRLPPAVDAVLVAGHGAYLTGEESERAIAPRLRAARERFPEAWIGTEGIERLSAATGGPQYELLSGSTPRDLRALRAAGFDATLAVYAPTVLSEDEDDLLDALGSYVARRGPVADTLSEDTATDASATGQDRETLLDAIDDYALVGSPETVSKRVEGLRAAGADVIVGYPARGLDTLLD